MGLSTSFIWFSTLNEILVVEKSSLVLVIKPLFIKVSGCNPSAFSIKSLTVMFLLNE